MGIKGFKDYLKQYKLVNIHKIQQLNGKRLGIDGNLWIKELLHRQVALFHEKLSIGTTQYVFQDLISYQIEKLREYEITPIFVFHGIELFKNGMENRDIYKKCYQQIMEAAQGENENLNTDEINQQERMKWYIGIRDLDGDIMDEIIRQTIQLLKILEIEVMRAPYYNWSQLLYFKQTQYIDEIYGDSELLLLEAKHLKRWVVDIDLEMGIVGCLHIDALKSVTNLNHEGLTRAGFIAGNSLLKTVKELKNLVREYGNVFAYAVVSLSTNKLAFVEQANYEKEKALLQESIVIDQTFEKVIAFQTTQFNPNQAMPCGIPSKSDAFDVAYNHFLQKKSDLPKVFHVHVFPSFYYICLAHGFLQPQWLTLLSHHHFYESIPIVDSAQYRVAISYLKPSLLSLLNEAVNLDHDLDYLTLHQLHCVERIKPSPPPTPSRFKYQLLLNLSPDEMKTCPSLGHTIDDLIQSVSLDHWRNSYRHVYEIVTTLHAYFLQFLGGYVDDFFKPLKKGSLLHSFCTQYPEHDFSFVLLCQLLESNLLNGDPVIQTETTKSPLSHPKSLDAQNNGPALLFISRIFCVLSPPSDLQFVSSETFTLPVLPDLVAWCSTIRRFVSHYTSSFEFLLLSLFSHHGSSLINGVQFDDLSDLSSRFHTFSTHCFSLLSMALDVTLRNPGTSFQLLYETHFRVLPSVAYLEHLVQYCFMLWQALYPLLIELPSLSSELRSLFSHAQKIMHYNYHIRFMPHLFLSHPTLPLSSSSSSSSPSPQSSSQLSFQYLVNAASFASPSE